MASQSAAITSYFTIGLELAMLGVATLVAASSEGTGQVLVVFMGGLLLLFFIYHTAFTKAIPNLFAMVPATATNAA